MGGAEKAKAREVLNRSTAMSSGITSHRVKTQTEGIYDRAPESSGPNGIMRLMKHEPQTRERQTFLPWINLYADISSGNLSSNRDLSHERLH